MFLNVVFFFLQGIAAAVVSTPTSLTAKPKVKKKKKVSFFLRFYEKNLSEFNLMTKVG